MAEKIEVEEEHFEQMKKMYLEDKLTTKQIAKQIGISATVIRNVLEEHELYVNTNDFKNYDVKTKGDLRRQIDEKKNELLNKEIFFKGYSKNSSVIIEKEIDYIAICKVTNKEFNDYKNSSGVLTEHLNEIFPGFIHPSPFLKREYKKKNGQYWHEQYFYIVEAPQEEEKPKLKCVYCDWTVADLENKSGWYTTHLKKEHGVLNLLKHIGKHPEDSILFKNIVLNEKKKEILESNDDNYIECVICHEKFSKINDKHTLTKHGITLSEYKMKYSTETMSSLFLDKVKEIYEKGLKHVPNSFVSSAEFDILFFLENQGLSLKSTDRKLLHGVEIDIFCEDKKIGIEFNGNMYHSEVFGKKDSKYHLNKTSLMNEQECGLIHIFEDEWEVKQEIVKSKLNHVFGLNISLPKIYARKCEIKLINDYEKNVFLNKNHIQGEDRSNLSLGAFYKEKLVSVMTFDSKRSMNMRIINDDSYELKRFATDINYVVIGIAGKLLKFFIENYKPKNIISFADRRWTMNSENNLYTKLGFKLTNILRPDYSYYNSKIDRYKRFHKFGFGKKSIKRKYPEIYSNDKTEWQMMQEAGFDRIWDCGKFVYELQVN